MRRRVLPVFLACACGPVLGGDEGDGTSGTTGTSAPHPVTVTANSTVPPQSEVSSLEGSFDAVSFEEEGGIYDIAPSDETFGPVCPHTVEVYPAIGGVSLLVDASQTMVTGLVDHDGDEGTPAITRWALLHAALLEHVPTLVEAAYVELWSFPSFEAEAPPSEAACVVGGVHPDFGSSAEQILQYLPPADATFFQGATPTATVLAGAQADLASLQTGGRHHIVVLTDGAPNCDNGLSPPELFSELDVGAYEWASYARDQGIDTHVIGIAVPEGSFGGGPEGDVVTVHRDALTLLASSGGTAAIFADDAAQLDAAFATIDSFARSCRLIVPSELAGLWYEVIVGDGRHYYELGGEACSTDAGYVRVPGQAVGEVIELCGSACQSLQVHGSAIIEEICVFPE